MRDISVEESEELPRILGAIAEDAPAAVLGGASALDQAPVDRDLLITAIEAASPALARLKVGTPRLQFRHHAVFALKVGRGIVELPDSSSGHRTGLLVQLRACGAKG